MHEWALAEAVLNALQEIAEREDLEEVKEVVLQLGELQQVDEEIFIFALSNLKTCKLNRAVFRIEKENAEFECRSCSNFWSFKDVKMDEEALEAIHFIPEIAHAFLRCPRCGSPDYNIVKGKGVWVKNIVGKRKSGVD
ncbi:MAG: hydrogenase nickel incorporation protein HypA [Nitrososphaerota archaeon]|nr:hydrogenase nickel incorporation protein HypA [Candidatus Bathyarchaeota archaeon]MDW8049424.1 hydrogenase nickel incorporation protein HypA [Nitrososphaerota archaeon]